MFLVGILFTSTWRIAQGDAPRFLQPSSAGVAASAGELLPNEIGPVELFVELVDRKEIATRPFQLVTGRVWRGTAFGGARGRTDVPKIVDWYMEGKINIDDLITHTMPLQAINDAFDLMHEGKSIRSVVIY